MRLAQVKGTVTATVKAPGLQGKSLLLTNVVDAHGLTLQESVVAVDTCGAGTGDLVLLAEGSAARLANDMGVIPVDASVIAVVDQVSK